jgi:hypothetical protein
MLGANSCGLGEVGLHSAALIPVKGQKQVPRRFALLHFSE